MPKGSKITSALETHSNVVHLITERLILYGCGFVCYQIAREPGGTGNGHVKAMCFLRQVNTGLFIGVNCYGGNGREQKI
jgi:hypothetical protein